MDTSLQVLRVADDDGELRLELSASNGRSATAIELFSNREPWLAFAEGLVAFPTSQKDVVQLELGKDEDRWAYYFLLRAFCLDRAGHSALEIVVVANGAPPFAHRERFFIAADPAALNRLGAAVRALALGAAGTVDWKPV